MSFLQNAIESFMNKSSHSRDEPPPQPPPPWIAEWDHQQDRWIFINQQNGERTHQFPQQGYGGGGGGGGYGGGYPPQQQYGGGYEQCGGGYGGGYEQQQQPEKKNHNLAYGALGAAAGVAGGAFLMHEGEEVKDDWDRDKYRAEGMAYDAGQDVENFPDNAAQWAGRTEQNVADIPQDVDRWEDRQEDRIEQKWDNGVQDVEDAPEDVARWTGEKLQDVEDIPGDIARPFENAWDGVERFGDNVGDAYDQGQDEGRRDDW